MKLDVSRGQPLSFEANGQPFSGVVVRAEGTAGPWATIFVETESPIPDGAQLSMREIAGGCGTAKSTKVGSRFRCLISIPYSHINASTLGE